MQANVIATFVKEMIEFSNLVFYLLLVNHPFYVKREYSHSVSLRHPEVYLGQNCVVCSHNPILWFWLQ